MRYREGYKYQLATNYRLEITGFLKHDDICANSHIWLDATKISIATGYAWDGASGPIPDTRAAMRASLVHDALYQLIREEILGVEHKHTADRLFRDLCIQDGMPKWRARLLFRGLLAFGNPATKPKNKRKVIEI